MRTVTIRQTDTGTWAADSTISTDIERVGLITRIEFNVEITPSATLDGANQPDSIFRLVQNLTVRGGSHTYFNLPADDGCQGGVLLHYTNQMDGFGYGHETGDVAAPSEAYVPAGWILHPGSRPRTWNRDNPFDLTAFIPAHGESQLVTEWRTSGNDVMDDVVTIASAVGRYTISRVVGTEAEIRGYMAFQGVQMQALAQRGLTGMVPAWSAINHANAGTTADFEAETIDIPTGGWLKRIDLVFQDATATRTLRAADEVTELSINSPKTNERLLQRGIESNLLQRLLGSAMEADEGAVDFGAHAPFGLDFIDMRERPVQAEDPMNADYGWDMRRAQNGDFRIGLLISNRAAGDDTLAIFERYIGYGGRLGI